MAKYANRELNHSNVLKNIGMFSGAPRTFLTA